MKAFKKVTEWCKEHSFELIFGGLGIGIALISYQCGYKDGEIEGKIEASNHYRNDVIQGLIENCGYYGFNATMRAIESVKPELYDNVCDVLDKNDVQIAEWYRNDPYVQKLKDDFSGDIVEFGKKVMSREKE